MPFDCWIFGYIYSLQDIVHFFAVATEAEFKRTKAICQEFMENEGPKLHKLLKEREKGIIFFKRPGYIVHFHAVCNLNTRWFLVIT